MSLLNGRPMVEPIPHRPIIFLSQMPEWVDNSLFRKQIQKDKISYLRVLPISIRIVGIIFGIVFGGLCLWVNINMLHDIRNLFDILIILVTFFGFVFPFIILIINCIQNPNRNFVYDRIKGTLTMPSNWFMWNNKTVTIPLKQVRYLIRPVVGPFGGVTIKIIFPKYKNPTHLLNITFGSHGMMDLRQLSNRAIRSELSVINWFMDRNRPLPPGLLFDPYREEDYLRRREEGFPFPLYETKLEHAIRLYKKDYVSKKVSMIDVTPDEMKENSNGKIETIFRSCFNQETKGFTLGYYYRRLILSDSSTFQSELGKEVYFVQKIKMGYAEDLSTKPIANFFGKILTSVEEDIDYKEKRTRIVCTLEELNKKVKQLNF